MGRNGNFRDTLFGESRTWGVVMKRFILISFGFLAFAFYEMSGGSDFDASAVRDARMAKAEAEDAAKQAKKLARAEAAKPAPAEQVVVAAAPKVIVDTDPPLDNGVTRVSLNLTTINTTSQAQPAAAVPQNVITSSADTPAIIPSLIDPNDGITADNSSVTVSIPTSAAEDIRTVSGNRVNVRGGPGTDFGIVGRLVRGDAVKIIQDDGNGWVRFEGINGDKGGWMADFLLTNG